jgi:hypothetical protein
MTDKNEVNGSSSAGSRSSADTIKGISCAVGAKRPKICPEAVKGTLRAIEAKRVETSNEARKTEVEEMDAPNKRVRRIETRSTTKEGE